jgi:hypothetical protein
MSYTHAQSDIGLTAVKGGEFMMPGYRVAKLVVQTAEGRTHMLLLNAKHTPNFEFNLISIPQLDCLGLQGRWGGGKLSVTNNEGITIIDGCLKLHEGECRLYKVNVIDNLGEQTEQTTSAASRFLDTKLISRHGTDEWGIVTHKSSFAWPGNH